MVDKINAAMDYLNYDLGGRTDNSLHAVADR